MQTPEEIAGMEALYSRLLESEILSEAKGLAENADYLELPSAVPVFLQAIGREHGLKRPDLICNAVLFGHNEGRYTKKLLLHGPVCDIIVSPAWDGWSTEFFWAAGLREEVKTDLKA